MEVLRRADQRNRRKWQRILGAMALAPDLDDENMPHGDVTLDPRGIPVGWRPREYQIAKDAKKSPKVAPMYLQVAARVASEGQRSDQNNLAPPNLNVDVQVFVRSDVTEYQIVELDPVGRRK